MSGPLAPETPSVHASAQESGSSVQQPRPWRRFLGLLNWTPPRCRHDPDREFPFTLPLNLLFSLASTVTVANLYYAYPVLNKIADDFGISYERASLIPTLIQAGYGCGILLLCPLGDSTRLRPFVIPLVLASTTIWIGLCITESFPIFCGLSFLAGFTSVTPQLMLPLADALAPPSERVRAVSIVFAGLMFGQVLPRVVSGIVTEYTHWRNVFWAALGLQLLLLALLWLFFPDYEPNNSGGIVYTQLLWSILRLVFTQPILAYGCLISLLSNAAMSSFWTTLTALLASSAYNFSPMEIGLFSLIAILPVAVVPLYGSIIIERFVTYIPACIALTIGLAGVAVGTFAGTTTIAAVIVQALSIDFGVDANSIAYRSAIYAAAPKGRNRVNVAYTACSFAGQLMGTGVGNSLYARGGWQRTGVASMVFLSSCLLLVLARGPHETRWIGWKSGVSARKKDIL